jgi:hypothetical protein
VAWNAARFSASAASQSSKHAISSAVIDPEARRTIQYSDRSIGLEGGVAPPAMDGSRSRSELSP